MDVHGSGSRSEKQVPPGGGQLPVGRVSLFWVVSWIGCDELTAFNQPSSPAPLGLANPVVPGDGRYVWVKLYTPAGINLFEKPCPR